MIVDGYQYGVRQALPTKPVDGWVEECYDENQARYLADAYNTSDAERNFVVVKRLVGEWEIA